MDSCSGVTSWDMTVPTGPSQALSIMSSTTIYQPLSIIFVVAIHAPELFGIRLLLMPVAATAVDPESHGYRLSKVTARHLHAKKLPMSFHLFVVVIQCHVQ
jgi:hypothetical protein